jgi:hypothetical protein
LGCIAEDGAEPMVYLIDSTIVKAHRAASGANVWPAPSASGFVMLA